MMSVVCALPNLKISWPNEAIFFGKIITFVHFTGNDLVVFFSDP